MNNQTDQRQKWDSGFGFLMAILAASLGIGGIWGFPIGWTTKNIGAYLIVYALTILIVGIPLILCAMAIVQKGNLNPLGPVKSLNKQWQWITVGVCCLIASVLLLIIGVTVGGWSISSVTRTLTAKLDIDSVIIFSRQLTYKTEILMFSGIFMLIVMTVAYLGINNGAERAFKAFLPISYFLLIVIAVRLSSVPDSKAWVKILKPSFKDLGFNTIVHAVFHAIITLGIGTGTYFTFSSHTRNKGDKGDSLVKYAVLCAVLIVLAMVTYGITILPILYTTNISAKSGLSNLLNLMPDFFYNMQYGGFTGFMFFVFVMLVTLMTAISLFEVVISYIVDQLKWKRSIVITGTGLLFLGIIYLGYLLITGNPDGLFISVLRNGKSLTSLIITISKYIIISSTLIVVVLSVWALKVRKK